MSVFIEIWTILGLAYEDFKTHMFKRVILNTRNMLDNKLVILY
jgi:hypothetical protein